METKTAEEARKGFADLLTRVGVLKETVVITRHGKPIAKMVPYETDEPDAE
jgi:prevent-host-death family protein